MPAVANRTIGQQAANAFPTIRFFSVGHRTASPTPLKDLQTVWEPWQVASNTTLDKDFGPGHTLFSTFSAVCWLFGKELSERLSPTGEVPIGLISNNWGGTKVEVWTPKTAYPACNRTGYDGPMYNAMILPYAHGPMALSGVTWYQGITALPPAPCSSYRRWAADSGCVQGRQTRQMRQPPSSTAASSRR